MFQDWMGPTFIQIVEEATGRTVRSFFSQVGYDPDQAVELSLFEPPATSGDGRREVPGPSSKDLDRRALSLPRLPKQPQTSQPPFSVQSERENKSEAETEAA